MEFAVFKQVVNIINVILSIRIVQYLLLTATVVLSITYVMNRIHIKMLKANIEEIQNNAVLQNYKIQEQNVQATAAQAALREAQRRSEQVLKRTDTQIRYIEKEKVGDSCEEALQWLRSYYVRDVPK